MRTGKRNSETNWLRLALARIKQIGKQLTIEGCLLTKAIMKEYRM